MMTPPSSGPVLLAKQAAAQRAVPELCITGNDRDVKSGPLELNLWRDGTEVVAWGGGNSPPLFTGL